MSMSSRAISWVFPLTLAVLMGGVTFWLNRATDVNVESVLLNPAKPQYVMHNLQGVKFSPQGQVAQSLTATSAQMFPNSTDVLINQPNGKAYENGQELYHVQSVQARYSNKQKQVFFDQDVLFTKAAVGGKPVGTVKTSQLQIDLPSQVAKTAQEVEYQYGDSTGSAIGFSYDKKNDVLHLDSRVKAIIYDQQ